MDAYSCCFCMILILKSNSFLKPNLVKSLVFFHFCIVAVDFTSSYLEMVAWWYSHISAHSHKTLITLYFCNVLTDLNFCLCIVVR